MTDARMGAMKRAEAAIAGFNFQTGVYATAESCLFRFAACYEALTAEEAEELRQRHDPKGRLGWFTTAANLVRHGFAAADPRRKKDLITIFFALYSFDNLDFGYDSVLHVMAMAELLQADAARAQRIWQRFAQLTSNPTARGNLESRLFRAHRPGH